MTAQPVQIKSETNEKKTHLVVDGVKLCENYSINEARLVGHGVVCQSLIKLNLRTKTGQH